MAGQRALVLSPSDYAGDPGTAAGGRVVLVGKTVTPRRHSFGPFSTSNLSYYLRVQGSFGTPEAKARNVLLRQGGTSIRCRLWRALAETLAAFGVGDAVAIYQAVVQKMGASAWWIRATESTSCPPGSVAA